ncbi:competence protein ComEC [Mucilaginibacter pineti]|uniref:Competence protein ComEC n=1 Tax=Mucilaginibacter pineti TaxID=1391627 RepID=A0A1G7HT54_9SPHI|nr:ComEC/Rec2 family competence protein [Mucilaginibacter pineti]SDF03667.1 competence protein ComEC [Mucilaginibacter pineti]
MIANHKGEIPVVVLLMPYLLGVALGIGWVSAIWLPVLWGVFIGLGAVFILLNLTYLQLGVYKFRWMGGLLMGFIMLAAGCISAISNNELNNTSHFSKSPAKHLLVKISNEPQLKNGLLRFTASVQQTVNNNQTHDASGTLLITIKDSTATGLQYGDELLVPGTYTAIDPPFNPGEFNYKKYLAHQNIYYQLFLYPGLYHVIEHDTGNPLIAYSLRLRQQMVQAFKQKMHNADAIAVASTLILGYKADLSNDILQAYSKTGTIHVLSVSGAHVAIIYVLLQGLLGFMNGRRYGRYLKMGIIVMLIGYYAMLTGFSPAVCRAAVMISMVIIGKNFARHINMLNILAISAFLLLLYNPLYITDVGFQLSYLAVAGLIVLQPVVYRWMKFKNKWADKLWSVCSVSIAAQVITFPLSAFYFHQFPVYFLVSNLLIIIPTAVIMYSGLGYLLLSWVPGLSTVLAWVLEQSILLMNKALAFIEHTPFASINKIWLTIPEYLLLYVLIISLFYFLYDRKRWLFITGMICLFLLAASISLKKYNAGNTRSIAFLNLRKNVGMVFKNGNQALVLTNLADTDKNYSYSIQPYLDSSQVSNVTIINPQQNVSLNYLHKRGNFIGFYNKRILLFDKSLEQSQLPQKLNVDFAYITGSPHTDIAFIQQNYNFNMLVMDESNSNALIAKLKAEADTLHINYKILKRNISLVTVSN